MEKTKVYVASSFTNVMQPRIVQLLLENGYEVYDFNNPPQGKRFSWKSVDDNWRSWSWEQCRDALRDNKAVKGFAREMRLLADADVCVLVLPCGKSAHLMAGWAKAKGKAVIAYIPEVLDVFQELMYDMFDAVVFSIDELLEWCDAATVSQLTGAGVKKSMYTGSDYFIDPLQESSIRALVKRRMDDFKSKLAFDENAKLKNVRATENYFKIVLSGAFRDGFMLGWHYDRASSRIVKR